MYKNTWARSTVRSPITCPAGIDKVDRIEYQADKPDDGQSRLKPGDRWVYWQVCKTEKERIDGRTYITTYWLAEILRPKGKGEPCFVWRIGKDDALKWKHRDEARKAAEESRGMLRQVQRKYLGKEMAG